MQHRLAKPEVAERIQRLVTEHEELADYAEHPPVIVVTEKVYGEGNPFDAAVKKKVGRKPFTMNQVTDKCLRFLFSAEGLGKRGAKGLDFIVKLDPAVWDMLPDKAKDAYLFNAMVTFYLERKEDGETGDQVVKTDDDGRPVWSKRTADAIQPETLTKFGPFSKFSAAIADAIQGAHAKEPNLFDRGTWEQAETVEAKETQEEIDAAFDGDGGTMRDVEDEGAEEELEPASA